MDQTIVQTALWTPGWYEMDQSLAVGERQKFWFFQTNPDTDYCGDPDTEINLVFFNQLDSSANCQVRIAKILEIKHKQLGLLSRIDTDGLDYIFAPIDGDEIIVNAEEDPGATYDSDLEIDDWSVIVMLSEVSEPVGDVV